MLDVSNDNGLGKTYPITLRIFGMNYSWVTNLIEQENASTEAAMFSSEDEQFEKFQILWEYCLVTGIGKANANIWRHNLTKSRALKKIVPL